MDAISVTVKSGQMEYDYQITPKGDNYIITQQDKEIAVIECRDEWVQVSGKQLPDGAIVEIIHAIETNYN